MTYGSLLRLICADKQGDLPECYGEEGEGLLVQVVGFLSSVRCISLPSPNFPFRLSELFHLTTVSFDFKLLLNVLCSILPFLFCPPSLPPIPNRGSVKSSAVGAVTGLCLDLSREWIWICWEWIDIWTRSFQFQAWLHLELLSCRGQWETPQSAQFGVAAIVFYGVSICQLALPFQSLKIFLNYGRSQYEFKRRRWCVAKLLSDRSSFLIFPAVTNFSRIICIGRKYFSSSQFELSLLL